MVRISISATFWMMAMMRSALTLVLAVALVWFCAGIGITVAVCQRIIFRIYVFIFWNNLGVLTFIWRRSEFRTFIHISQWKYTWFILNWLTSFCTFKGSLTHTAVTFISRDAGAGVWVVGALRAWYITYNFHFSPLKPSKHKFNFYQMTSSYFDWMPKGFGTYCTCIGVSRRRNPILHLCLSCPVVYFC